VRLTRALWLFRLFHSVSNVMASAVLAFGLWLIPLGLLVLRSGWAPPALGWLRAWRLVTSQVVAKLSLP